MTDKKKEAAVERMVVVVYLLYAASLCGWFGFDWHAAKVFYTGLLMVVLLLHVCTLVSLLRHSSHVEKVKSKLSLVLIGYALGIVAAVMLAYNREYMVLTMQLGTEFLAFATNRVYKRVKRS